MKRYIILAVCLAAISCTTMEKAEHVFFIGLDGWGSYTMESADMPNVRKLMDEGAYTLKKRTVLPSHSASNWASMFMGAGPEIHGFYECCSTKPDLEPRFLSENGIFPTIFQLLRNMEPEAEIGAIYEWKGIEYLIDTLSMSKYANIPQKHLCDSAKAYIIDKKPKLAAFIYDDPDHVGHRYGHDTDELYAKMEELDARIGELLDAIEQAGIMDDSIIILTSDHGGIKHSHGGTTMMEMETPLIVYGKGIKKGFRFDDISVAQCDVASTIAYIFGLEQPQAWYGRAIKCIFD